MKSHLTLKMLTPPSNLKDNIMKALHKRRESEGFGSFLRKITPPKLTRKLAPALIVVALFLSLSGILVMNVGGARQQARRSTSSASMAAVDTALEMFKLDWISLAERKSFRFHSFPQPVPSINATTCLASSAKRPVPRVCCHESLSSVL